MGSNIARNFARHGYTVALHTRSIARTDSLLAEHGSEGKFLRSETIPEFVAVLEEPRRVPIMVKAGNATDAVINELADATEEGDIIIDGGNALYTDTIRREKAMRERGHLRRRGGCAQWAVDHARRPPSAKCSAMKPSGSRQ
jgi:6-phosphogluconate dehydrogenase